MKYKKSQIETAESDLSKKTRFSPDDPYYSLRLGPFHTCLYVRACRLVTGTSSTCQSPPLPIPWEKSVVPIPSGPQATLRLDGGAQERPNCEQKNVGKSCHRLSALHVLGLPHSTSPVRTQPQLSGKWEEEEGTENNRLKHTLPNTNQH